MNNFKRKDWGVEKIGGEGKESFNMAPEIEFSQKFNFPPSHKTASYTGYELVELILGPVPQNLDYNVVLNQG